MDMRLLGAFVGNAACTAKYLAHTHFIAGLHRGAGSASVKPLLRKNFLICSIVVTPICCIVYALLLGLVWDSRAGFMHSFI